MSEGEGARDPDRRLPALGLPARRRDHHAAADRADRVLHRRPGGRADGREPVHDLQGDLRRARASTGCFPWISSEDRTLAALNLQQTLILTTPLILTGMAVAYAFRAGLFNIGGQGQYFAGLYLGVMHRLVAATGCRAGCTSCWRWSLGTLAGAIWGGIAGFLKARRAPTR